MSLCRSVAAMAVTLATVSSASAAWASPWVMKPGEFYSELSGSFFSSSTYLQNGDGRRIQLGGKLEQRTVRSHNELGWKKSASVWIDVPFVSRTYANDAGGSVTSTGLGDLDFGIRYGLHRGNMPLALELGWTAPLGGNRRLFPGTGGSGGLDGTSYGALADGQLRDSSAFFDTGLQSLSAALELGGTAGKRSYWTLGGGYRTHFLSIGSRRRPVGVRPNTIQNNNRWLDAVTGGATLGFWFSSSLLVTGTFRGEFPIYQSERYDRIVARIPGPDGPDLEVKYVLAGPRFTYRVDDRMDVFAGSWHTASGRNVLHSDQFYCGIAWKQTGLDRLAGAFGGTQAH